MTQNFSVAYPVVGGPSKWDLVQALFDSKVRWSVLFTFGTTPLERYVKEEITWSMAFRDPPKAFDSETRVIGVSTYVTKGDSYHINAHVMVPRSLIIGCARDVGKKEHIKMLADIYFVTDKRKGSVCFRMIPD